MNRLFTWITLLFLTIFISPSWASLELVQGGDSRTHAPRGLEDVVMYTFQLDSTADDVVINEIVVENNSADILFGFGITEVNLYLDTNLNGTLELSGINPDVLLSTKALSVGSNAEQQLPFLSNQTISSANASNTGFIITYDISGTQAKLESITNVTLTEVKSVGGLENLDVALHDDPEIPSFNNVTITGIKKVVVQDIAPNVVLPGQTDVPMLYISITIDGESISGLSEMNFTMYNESNNFVTDNGDTTGVIKASMYAARFAPPFIAENENESASNEVFPSEFRDMSSFDFNFPPYEDFTGLINDAVTQNFYVLFDIGEDISVTSETKISAQLFEFSGFGNSSFLEIQWPLGESRFDAASTLVAGLSLVEIDSEVPADSIFGAETEAPILSFKLRANHTDITVNTVTIHNPNTDTGWVPFITEEGETDGVTRVNIYADNGNAKFSDTTDVLVGTVDLGETNDITGIKNQDNVVVVPLFSSLDPLELGFSISSYNSEALGYNSNNDAIFFVTYSFGSGVDGGHSIARLGNVTATANLEIEGLITSAGLTLSGVDNDDNAAASPDARINLTDVNVSIVDISDISPANTYLGQLKVPMLAMELSSDLRFPSAGITITNGGNTFLSDNTGVSKVWIYRDNGIIGKFEDGIDQFINSVSAFSDREEVLLPGIDINIGTNTYIVLYDIGQNANGRAGPVISTNLIKAKINTIETDTDAETTLILGTQLKESSTVSVSLPFINNIDVIITNPSDPVTSTLNVEVEFTNTSGSTIFVDSLIPRIYFTDLSGRDISYEFNIVPDDDTEYPFEIANDASAIFDFDVRHVAQESEGPGILDATLYYRVPDSVTPTSSSIILSRYQGTTGFKSGVSSPPVLSLFASFDDYFWVFPSYISLIQYERSLAFATFSQGMALKQGDKLHITFQEKGQFIDQSTLSLTLNGSSLTRVSTLSATSGINTYFYNETTGIISIGRLGTTSGTIELNVSDGTNDLEQTTITYDIDSTIQLSNVLFYPNPYRMGNQDLILGYFATPEKLLHHYGQINKS